MVPKSDSPAFQPRPAWPVSGTWFVSLLSLLCFLHACGPSDELWRRLETSNDAGRMSQADASFFAPRFCFALSSSRCIVVRPFSHFVDGGVGGSGRSRKARRARALVFSVFFAIARGHFYPCRSACVLVEPRAGQRLAEVCCVSAASGLLNLNLVSHSSMANNQSSQSM